MSDDFDIAELAAYLHLMPEQVQKLADRRKLPGRRVAGKWRFSRREVHHWLEERIGISAEDDLVQMEGALQRAGGAESADAISITQLLDLGAIAIPLVAKTRTSVVSEMSQLAASTGCLWDPDAMAEAVLARESMHPTALDNGVALLHPRRPLPAILNDAMLALGVTPQGVPFGGGHGLTDIFFLIASTSDHQHLRILARLARVISDPQLLSSLRDADSPAAAYEAVAKRDEELEE